METEEVQTDSNKMLDNLEIQMSDMKIGEKMEQSCPICEKDMKCSKGIYKCCGGCYFAKYPGSLEYLNYVRDRLRGFRLEHKYFLENMKKM